LARLARLSRLLDTKKNTSLLLFFFLQVFFGDGWDSGTIGTDALSGSRVAILKELRRNTKFGIML
jgi:hypothetical protein